MTLPIDAPYKIAQAKARASKWRARWLYRATHPATPAQAVREGKLNRKSGRRLAVSYR